MMPFTTCGVRVHGNAYVYAGNTQCLGMIKRFEEETRSVVMCVWHPPKQKNEGEDKIISENDMIFWKVVPTRAPDRSLGQ